MSFDRVLQWMTSTGQGAWPAFRAAVRRVVGTEDEEDLVRTCRFLLSDLAHADFFVDGSQSWRVLAPHLASVSACSNETLLCGGRTPGVLSRMSGSAARFGCSLVEKSTGGAFTIWSLKGEAEQLQRVADDARVPLVDSYVERLVAGLVPIPQVTAAAKESQAPVNWQVRSFDFATRSWRDGAENSGALEFTSRNNVRRYCVRVEGALREVEKREAIYWVAHERGERLVVYDPRTAVLDVSAACPLPERLARAAAICAQAPARYSAGRLTYQSIASEQAALIMVAAGQLFPSDILRG